MKLKEKYQKQIVPALIEKFGLKSAMLAPRFTKVVLNVGFGHHAKEKEFMTSVEKGLTKIAGQKPVFTAAKKSVSAFKIREGMTIGAKVTLRGQRMYDFIDKLVNITFPRVRDFRGLSEKAVDNKGNLTVGFKEFVSFPEIRVEEIDNNMYGLEVCLATNSRNREEGLELFQLAGFPFKKDSK
ncbi:MAG: 50S ribosomal protein L5 [Patescibacteria group bacterium]